MEADIYFEFVCVFTKKKKLALFFSFFAYIYNLHSRTLYFFKSSKTLDVFFPWKKFPDSAECITTLSLKKKLCVDQVWSLLDNAPDYIVGFVIQKRTRYILTCKMVIAASCLSIRQSFMFREGHQWYIPVESYCIWLWSNVIK